MYISYSYAFCALSPLTVIYRNSKVHASRHCQLMTSFTILLWFA